MYDSYGDGILSPGFYMVKDATGNVLAYGGSNYTTEDQTNFETAPVVIGIDEISKIEIIDNRIFDILGREWKGDFIDLPKGMYIINHNKIFKTQ